MQVAADAGDARALYHLARTFMPRQHRALPQVREASGAVIADPVAARRRWMDHFCDVFGGAPADFQELQRDA
eukprot:8978121-Lingulodinium_polyedra.AAC.1